LHEPEVCHRRERRVAGEDLLGVIASHGPYRESDRSPRKSRGSAKAIAPPPTIARPLRKKILKPSAFSTLSPFCAKFDIRILLFLKFETYFAALRSNCRSRVLEDYTPPEEINLLDEGIERYFGIRRDLKIESPFSQQVLRGFVLGISSALFLERLFLEILLWPAWPFLTREVVLTSYYRMRAFLTLHIRNECVH
jgi:hypothetical protein